MSSVVKKLFGGTDKSSLEAQQTSNADTQRFIEQQGAQGRSDILGLAPGVGQNLNLGAQAALDVYGQTIPQQLSTFQQGNVGAQGALLAGMPQFQNAIMGTPVDYSQFQPQAIQYDPSFAQQQLPDFVGPGDLLPAPGQEQPQQQNAIAQYLAGLRG